eukprot:1138057-Pelagomonas_calceolata.AAC.7
MSELKELEFPSLLGSMCYVGNEVSKTQKERHGVELEVMHALSRPMHSLKAPCWQTMSPCLHDTKQRASTTSPLTTNKSPQAHPGLRQGAPAGTAPN